VGTYDPSDPRFSLHQLISLSSLIIMHRKTVIHRTTPSIPNYKNYSFNIGCRGEKPRPESNSPKCSSLPPCRLCPAFLLQWLSLSLSPNELRFMTETLMEFSNSTIQWPLLYSSVFGTMLIPCSVVQSVFMVCK
jgi:hypothetical protein